MQTFALLTFLVGSAYALTELTADQQIENIRRELDASRTHLADARAQVMQLTSKNEQLETEIQELRENNEDAKVSWFYAAVTVWAGIRNSSPASANWCGSTCVRAECCGRHDGDIGRVANRVGTEAENQTPNSPTDQGMNSLPDQDTYSPPNQDTYSPTGQKATTEMFK